MNESDVHGRLVGSDRTRFDLAVDRLRSRLVFTKGRGIGKDLAAARLVARVLPPLVDSIQGPAMAPSTWLNSELASSVAALQYRVRAAEILAVGVKVILATNVEPSNGVMKSITRLAFSLDHESRILGNLIAWTPIPDPFVPPDLEPLIDAIRYACVADVIDAALKFEDSVSMSPDDFLQNARIDSLSPDRACTGQSIKIRGVNFGSACPEGIDLVFSKQGGGCVVGEIVNWSPGEVDVRLPSGATVGCVRFRSSMYADSQLRAANSFASRIHSCMGGMVGDSVEAIRQAGMSAREAALCPNCTDASVKFHGGLPDIEFFTVDGLAIAESQPGENVTLRWRVRGAQTVEISVVSGQLPGVDLGGKLDEGSVVIGPLQRGAEPGGTWKLIARNVCGVDTAIVTLHVLPRSAIVISGGGSRGAFSVGVVKYLYGVIGVRPDILSGCSVGALNAAKLAEGGDEALGELEEIWLALTSDRDLYVEREWFRVLEPALKALFKVNAGSAATELLSTLAATRILGGLASLLGIPGIFFSVFTLFFPALTAIIDAGRILSAVDQASKSPSLFVFTPTEEKIRANIDPSKVAESGIELRISTVSLASGETVVVDQHGIVGGTDKSVPLLDAVRASAAIPLAFPPVELELSNGVHPCVDGGVRELAPIEAAVRAGATKVYAIMHQSVGQLAPCGRGLYSTIGQLGLIDIAQRSFSAIAAEAVRNDIAPYSGFGVPVEIIAPTVSVHDALMVDPGLIAINLGYGFMRAFDVVSGPVVDRCRLMDLSDRITEARVDAWHLEHYANARRLPWYVPPRGDRLVPVKAREYILSVRDAKRRIRELIRERLRLGGNRCMPADFELWWQQWERHPWNPDVARPWDRDVMRNGEIVMAESDQS